MDIRRAMPVVVSTDLAASRAFYVDFLGFAVAMDEPGFLMLRSPSVPTTQLLVATAEAADAGVLEVDLSIEVDAVEAAHDDAVRRGLEIVYPLTDEPWGIRRFFVRDPSGRTVNVASHRPAS
jgi:catechol 2,3-dioxygenase-like lactoylglutathione lyase family enzyme